MRREQYFEKNEVLRKVLSPTVTEIPLGPRDRTTASVFLQCPSVTRTLAITAKKKGLRVRGFQGSSVYPWIFA
jgi:hypothetical protein